MRLRKYCRPLYYRVINAFLFTSSSEYRLPSFYCWSQTEDASTITEPELGGRSHPLGHPSDWYCQLYCINDMKIDTYYSSSWMKESFYAWSRGRWCCPRHEIWAPTLASLVYRAFCLHAFLSSCYLKSPVSSVPISHIAKQQRPSGSLKSLSFLLTSKTFWGHPTPK